MSSISQNDRLMEYMEITCSINDMIVSGNCIRTGGSTDLRAIEEYFINQLAIGYFNSTIDARISLNVSNGSESSYGRSIAISGKIDDGVFRLIAHLRVLNITYIDSVSEGVGVATAVGRSVGSGNHISIL